MEEMLSRAALHLRLVRRPATPGSSSTRRECCGGASGIASAEPMQAQARSSHIRIGRAIHAHQRAVHARTDGGRAPLSHRDRRPVEGSSRTAARAPPPTSRASPSATASIHGAIQKGMQRHHRGAASRRSSSARTPARAIPSPSVIYDGTVIQASDALPGPPRLLRLPLHRPPRRRPRRAPHRGARERRPPPPAPTRSSRSSAPSPSGASRSSSPPTPPTSSTPASRRRCSSSAAPSRDSGTEIHRLPADFERRAMRSTMGEIWASSGEEGLLDMLPEGRAATSAAEAWVSARAHHPPRRGRARRRQDRSRR